MEPRKTAQPDVSVLPLFLDCRKTNPKRGPFSLGGFKTDIPSELRNPLFGNGKSETGPPRLRGKVWLKNFTLYTRRNASAVVGD